MDTDQSRAPCVPQVQVVDLTTDLMAILESATKTAPVRVPGMYHHVQQKHFQFCDAMKFILSRTPLSRQGPHSRGGGRPASQPAALFPPAQIFSPLILNWGGGSFSDALILNHDDGMSPEDWPAADVLLLGVSRVGKLGGTWSIDGLQGSGWAGHVCFCVYGDLKRCMLWWCV